MSIDLDKRVRGKGTKFRLFAQSPTLDDFKTPEVVWVSSPKGSLNPGPADHRMYVVDAIDKTHYDSGDMGPYRGPKHDAVKPNRDGHFDHLDPADRRFWSAHSFGVVRRVLDIWEDYLGLEVPWHFEPFQSRLEIVPWVDWKNAQFGWGFMESGYGLDDRGEKRPFCLNFDVMAHETGHSLVFSIVGFPELFELTAEYRGFHESASDMVALISALHFESFQDHILKKTGGNLYLENELNRIGELSKTKQIRIASNALTMDQVADTGRPHDDLSGKEIHALGQPLTGALFDILVGIYQEKLIEFGAISRELADRSSRPEGDDVDSDVISAAYARAYREAPYSFRDALSEARDALGVRLAHTWRDLPPGNLTFAKVARAFLTIDRRFSGQRYQDLIVESFHWRKIGFQFSVKGLLKSPPKRETQS
ncbi:MAG: hypothetical protein AAF530_23535 [Pseudomonadota bacterium]